MGPDDPCRWLPAALDRIPNARVAVLGDFCLDAYWETDNNRSELSVETGLPTRAVKTQRYRLAGKAFDHTAAYDTAIARYFSATDIESSRFMNPVNGLK